MSKWSNDLTSILKEGDFTSSKYHTGRYAYIPYLAFDNHIHHDGCAGFQIVSPNKDTEWLKIDFINPVQPSKITLQANDDLTLPKKIKISMSNDAITYDDIDIIDNIINDINVNEYVYKTPNKKYRHLKIQFLEPRSTSWIEINQIQFFEKLQTHKYLIKQNNNYHTIKSNLHPLGKPADNTELKTWFDKHGTDNINILTETLSKKETSMTKEEVTSIWKTDFELNANDIMGNIELIDTDENNKSIKYDCNNYRILDLLQNKFDIMMLKEK